MMVETAEGVRFERFLMQYNFPPYSVGETRPVRGPGRREVGHGTLARRALEPVLPAPKSYPYTIRVLSEITESNGSSSMATVCGATLALMDGGVPITAPVAGIAMGLVKEGDTVVVLSDILGDEDHLGDMDFKIAGTAEGITAIQMDNKIGSLPGDIMNQVFEQAREGRLHILGVMAETLAQPRPEVKSNAPLNEVISISTSRVGALIGPGGKVIQEIQSRSGCKMEVDNDGNVRISAPSREARDIAAAAILEVAGTLEVGEIYEGEVTGIKDFGAFVRIRGQEGLVHVSQWEAERVEDMNAVVKTGEKVRVKVLPPDRQGRLSLSRKEAL
jgi:polyribonucleotide nucleotidyltransferase